MDVGLRFHGLVRSVDEKASELSCNSLCSTLNRSPEIMRSLISLTVGIFLTMAIVRGTLGMSVTVNDWKWRSGA